MIRIAAICILVFTSYFSQASHFAGDEAFSPKNYVKENSQVKKSKNLANWEIWQKQIRELQRWMRLHKGSDRNSTALRYYCLKRIAFKAERILDSSMFWESNCDDVFYSGVKALNFIKHSIKKQTKSQTMKKLRSASEKLEESARKFREIYGAHRYDYSGYSDAKYSMALDDFLKKCTAVHVITRNKALAH